MARRPQQYAYQPAHREIFFARHTPENAIPQPEMVHAEDGRQSVILHINHCTDASFSVSSGEIM